MPGCPPLLFARPESSVSGSGLLSLAAYPAGGTGWVPCCVLTGDREALWAELKAGAESGWDFSSRWLIGGPNPNSLSGIRTSKLVPVDLNAFLCQAEELMSKFYSRLGEHPRREG